MKKKIIIVDCNAQIGGIQKALIALLKKIHQEYDITLLLLHKKGILLSEIPENIRVITTSSDFKYMGMAQTDCKTNMHRIRRGLYVLISRYLGRKWAVRLALATVDRSHQEIYDVAIAYSHVASENSFYGGAPEYVLQAVQARKKICYIHCDYAYSGNRSNYSDSIYSKYDSIICVSESTRKHFIAALPDLKNRTYAALNPIDEEDIMHNARLDAVVYDAGYLNLVSVARLTKEKGISRMVNILAKIDTSRIRYHIIGEGRERIDIENTISEKGLKNVVTLWGEDANPYRYMENADLLVVPSFHEAAPVVFQEARVLGIPTLTTRTTSADEMIGEDYGFVTDNNDVDLEKKLRELVAEPEILYQKKKRMQIKKRKKDTDQLVLTEIIENLLTE